jgi:hypothetical protein
MGIKQRREALAAAAEVVVSQGVGSEELRAALGEWLKVRAARMRRGGIRGGLTPGRRHMQPVQRECRAGFLCRFWAASLWRLLIKMSHSCMLHSGSTPSMPFFEFLNFETCKIGATAGTKLESPQVKENGALAATAGRAVEAALGALPAAARGDVATAGGAALAHVAGNVDLLDKPSVWIIGGDGWAYDVRARRAGREGAAGGMCGRLPWAGPLSLTHAQSHTPIVLHTFTPPRPPYIAPGPPDRLCWA